jgi:hypothetical protein
MKAQDLEMNKRLMKKNLGKRLHNEAVTRKQIMDVAKLQGSDGEAKKIFELYDRLLLNNTNPEERQQIAIMGAAEIHKLLNVQGALIVDGFEIIPALKEIDA